jgi:L-iditol 2-dehydrogenase
VDRGVFHIPENVSYEEASFMEPLACVLRGQRNAQLKAGQSVLVLGSGISGLLHVALARALGARLVIAADTIAFRRDKAKEVGADLALEVNEDLIPKLRELNGGYLADLVIICFEGFIPMALEAVERGGTVLFFAGASEGATIPATIHDLFWRTEITLTSTYAGSPADCSQALQLIQGGRVPVLDTVTDRLSLREGPSGFQAVCSPAEHDCIKVIIEPQR